jgi:hypothetical protein
LKTRKKSIRDQASMVGGGFGLPKTEDILPNLFQTNEWEKKQIGSSNLNFWIVEIFQNSYFSKPTISFVFTILDYFGSLLQNGLDRNRRTAGKGNEEVERGEAEYLLSEK